MTTPSHHDAQRLLDAVAEHGVFHGRFDLDGVLPFLRGNNNERHGKRRFPSDVDRLPMLPPLESRAAQILLLEKVNNHLGKAEKTLGPSLLVASLTAATHSSGIRTVVVDHHFDFQLFSTNSKVGEFHVKKKVLPDNDLQRFGYTDT